MDTNLEEIIKGIKEKAKSKQEEILDEFKNDMDDVFSDYNNKINSSIENTCKQLEKAQKEMEDASKTTVKKIDEINKSLIKVDISKLQKQIEDLKSTNNFEDFSSVLEAIKQKQKRNSIICFCILGIQVLCFGIMLFLLFR